MKRTAIWFRHGGGYQVLMPGFSGVTIWFSRLKQLKAFAITNEVMLREAKR